VAFVRPTLGELVDRIQQDLQSRLGLASPILRRALVYVLARVLAGAVHMLHGHLEFLARQAFPDLSDGDFLIRQAALFGLSRKAAEYAFGNVTIAGTNGYVIPAGTVLLRADGAAYVMDADATISGGTATAAVTARDAGEDGNAAAGDPVSFESPIAGVNAAAVVAAGGLTNGSDQETVDSLRCRLLERLAEPPHGGNAADYVAWAKAVAGVTRAWCYPTESGAGTVVVRFVRDDDASIIPDSTEVAAVQTYIDERRPVTATVTVAAPTAVALNFTIHITPDSTATRAAVEAELRDLLRRDARPGGTILLSQIRVAIGVAEGVTDFTMASPVADVTRTTGQLTTFGTVTWT
jgi:uncharacterized phage protein gp47/JayE